ncbi:MAG: class I SAM-dependent methyltransferase [Chitinophagales bacterium]
MSIFEDKLSSNVDSQKEDMRQYYRFQAKIYDSTRWTFLFGRKEIIDQFPFAQNQTFRVLEIGCGTGSNLLQIADNYPNAKITGLDISKDMIQKADKKLKRYAHRVELLNEAFGADFFVSHRYDLVLFSYSLSMMNPQWSDFIQLAQDYLSPTGYIAVVDFHNSPIKSYKKWMRNNHVRMDAHLLPALEKEFMPINSEIKKAYWGSWQYFLFVGQMKLY